MSAPTFWDQHNADTTAFQEAQLLNIVAEYSIEYNKLPCRISSLEGNEYIQEFITAYHPCHYQEVFCMSLETFLVSKNSL